MNSRVSKKSHQACDNCRRKKTRCPGERPACSTCTRLRQSCQYSRSYYFDRPPDSDGVFESRLQLLEEKLDLMIESSIPNRPIRTPPTPKSYSRGQHDCETTSESTEVRATPSRQGRSDENSALQIANILPLGMPPQDIVDESIALYFKYCHKQPLWLFDPSDLSNPAECRDEVIFGILSLALRYSENPSLEGRIDRMCRQYAENARNLIMVRISQGTVNLSTMQGLCLIALAQYIANDTHLAWLHIGLVTNLAKCGGIDIELHEGQISPSLEARRRLFWSIHLLNQQYGLHSMQVNFLRSIDDPKYMALNMDVARETGLKPPQTPQGSSAYSPRGDIWVYMVQLASLWSEVQHYVSHCANGDPAPPWSVKSGYSIIGAHLMDLETSFPTAHRYDSVRFQDQSREDLHRDRWYWSPWLYLQFTYHAIHSVLNHPFLYSWRPQQSSQLAVPNTFWKTSSELALIHSTWTVRLIEMVTEKGFQLSDPSLGHLIAIAASIHIYYCRAADPAVRESAQRGVDTCTRFLGEFTARWPRCESIYQKLQTLVQSAFAVSPNSHKRKIPRRTLSIDTALMWDILLHNSAGSSSSASPGGGLFDSSFLETPGGKKADKVTVETEIFHRSTRAIDTSDGGQALPPYSSTADDRDASEDSGIGPWQDDDLAAIDNNNTEHAHLPRDALASSVSGFPGDMSFMDITHDPFFQFQDHQQPYMGGIWEIGNL